MKSPNQNQFLIAALSLAAITPTLHAADATWNIAASGTGAVNWSSAGLWIGGVPADGAGFTASFTGINITANKTITLDSSRTIGNITFTDATTPTNDLTITHASNVLTLAVASGSPQINVTDLGRGLTITASIAGTNGFTKTGPGFLTLNATATSPHTYSGVTRINAGRVTITTAGGLSPNTSFDISGSASGGGQLFVGGAITSITNNFSISGVGYQEAAASANLGGAIRAANNQTWSGSITLTGDARIGMVGGGTTATFSGKLSGPHALNFYGGPSAINTTHTHVLANTGTANDYSGDTSITVAEFSATTLGPNANIATQLRLGASEQIPNGSGKGILVFNGTSAQHRTVLDLNGFNETINGLSNTTAAGAIIRNTAAGASTLTIGDADTSSSFSGTLTDGGAANSLAITKTGNGTLTLSGSHNYSGATTVQGGSLVINGNVTSAVTIESGASFGGDATVGPLTVLAGGTLAPGNSPGIINSGDYNQAGTISLELNGLAPGSQHDQVNVTGSVTLGGSLVTLFGGGYVPAFGDMLFIMTNDGSDPISGTFAGLAEGSTVTSYGGFDWRISYAADSTSASFSGGNDIALMAIPEPSAALLGGLGALALLRRRRA